MLREKRGAELSMNVIIVAIIVILVLVVVVVFFLGGFNSIAIKLRNLVGSTSTDLSTAIVRCNSWCSNYETTTNKGQWQANFCGTAPGSTFDIDVNNDDKIEPGVDRTNQNCFQIGASCASINREDCV